MDDLLQKINARLQHYNRDELMALIWDFLSDRDADDLTEFLDLMRQKSRPAALEPLELQDANDLLGSIQDLHDAIANDEYVQYGSGYDPDYGAYRGFGDDSWIDEAVRVYERLLARAVDGRTRESYAVAGSYAKVIRATRTLQGRGDAFDAYYQRLFDTYPRLPAFKDELRSAIEGRGYQRKR